MLEITTEHIRYKFQIRNILPVPPVFRLLRQKSYCTRKQTYDSGRERHLHVVSHGRDVSGRQSYQSRAHRNQCSHQTEHRTEFGESFRNRKILVRFYLEVGKQPAQMSRTVLVGYHFSQIPHGKRIVVFREDAFEFTCGFGGQTLDFEPQGTSAAPDIHVLAEKAADKEQGA